MLHITSIVEIISKTLELCKVACFDRTICTEYRADRNAAKGCAFWFSFCASNVAEN